MIIKNWQILYLGDDSKWHSFTDRLFGTNESALDWIEQIIPYHPFIQFKTSLKEIEI